MKKFRLGCVLALILSAGLCDFVQAERTTEIEIEESTNSKKAALRMVGEFIDMGCWIASIRIEDPFWLPEGKKDQIYRVRCRKEE